MPALNETTLLYILICIVLGLALFIAYLEHRTSKLLVGKDSKSLEDSINKLRSEIASLQKFRDESIDYLMLTETRLKRSVQSVETVRFNPFKGTGDGGNQSFSTAMLNEKGDGLVLSALYMRDSVNVYGKPIKKFESEFELTGEEKNVIKNAKENLKNPK